MDALLALAGIRPLPSSGSDRRHPTGKSLLSAGRRATRALSFSLLAVLLFAGCDDSDPADASNQNGPGASPDEAAILPQAPWFEMPDDWDASHPIVSPNAKLEAHFISLAEGQMALIEGDGGGRAWIESVTPIDPDSSDPGWRREDADDASSIRPRVPAASLRRFEIGFEVGPSGIEDGGLIFVMPDPFWSWSEAQTNRPEARGYTTATPRGSDVRLEQGEYGAEFLVEGRALEAGERIDISFGAGPLGARVDEFAEHDSEILIAVDADGDGTRRWLADTPRLDIVGRGGIGLVAFGPAEVAPGDEIEVSIAIVDGNANRALWPADSLDESGRAIGNFEVERSDATSLDELVLPKSIRSRSAPDQPHRFRFDAPEHEGTIRLEIRGTGLLEGLDASVNPIVVRRSARRLVWADLHGHSRLSDGTGTPDDYFAYARDIARLDVISLTDHDHWGVRPLDGDPEIANRILRTAIDYNEPGRFVTLPGYEWTNWVHGHRHVLYFDESLPIFSAIDPATDRPDELWAALRGLPALTFAHHSAGEPVATNWFYAPDPELEPLTEVSSVHGMSEAADAPLTVRGGIPGNFVRDALIAGYRLGFVGSGDSHDGHPGLAHLITGQGGLAGVFTNSLDRKGLHAAMKARSTFATNGIRPWLEVSIDGTFMGEAMSSSSREHVLRIRYEATTPVERVDLVRSGRVARIEGEDALSIDITRAIPPLLAGEFHYVRIVERGGGVAWSSPIFVDSAGGTAGTTPD